MIATNTFTLTSESDPGTVPTQAAPIWQAALCELQLQMTKATFDTWVKPTFPIAFDPAARVLTVGVRNEYAKQWLENRLYGMVSRTLLHVLDAECKVKFVLNPSGAPGMLSPTDEPRRVEQAHAVQERAAQIVEAKTRDAAPGDVVVEVLQSPLEPWLKVQKYALWFWKPLMGCVAWSTWEMLRSMDVLVNEGVGKQHRISVEIIADTLAVPRQQITGVKRGPEDWQPGAFDTLNALKIAKIVARGSTPQSMRWYAKVLNALPLLTPQQVQALTPILRERHENFLEMFRVDHEIWEQLALDSLVRGIE